MAQALFQIRTITSLYGLITLNDDVLYIYMFTDTCSLFLLCGVVSNKLPKYKNCPSSKFSCCFILVAISYIQKNALVRNLRCRSESLLVYTGFVSIFPGKLASPTKTNLALSVSAIKFLFIATIICGTLVNKRITHFSQ